MTSGLGNHNVDSQISTFFLVLVVLVLLIVCDKKASYLPGVPSVCWLFIW